MPIAGVIAEFTLGAILFVVIAALVLGWRPKLSPVRVWLFGALLVIANITVMHLSQEQSDSTYVFTVLLLVHPILWLAACCDARMPVLSKMVAVGSAIWILCLFEFGAVFSSYVAVLSATFLIILIFQHWRDPKEEGFVKTSRKDWQMAFKVAVLMVGVSVAMIGLGWERVVIAQYPTKLQCLPLLSAVLFFLVKAIPEELVFRGIFQGALKDEFGFMPALIGSTLFYGVAALNNPALWAFPNWHAAANALLLGLGCGYVYDRTKSLAMSGVVNAVVSFGWWHYFARGGF